MKLRNQNHSLLLVVFGVLLAGCQPDTHSHNFSPWLEDRLLSLSQVENPSPTAVDTLDAVRAFHVTARQEIDYFPPDGPTFSGRTEFNYTWTQTQGPYGYNAHGVTTIIDPQSGIPSVMDESYVVDDVNILFCPYCPGAADRGGWSVSKRSEDTPGEFAIRLDTDLDIGSVERIFGTPLSALVPQSAVVGEEDISGIATTHYRLTDPQTLSETIRMRMGGAPNTPLEITRAQMDTWLTVGERRPLQYIFQAEGKTEMVAGSQLLQPFTLQERYSVMEINSNITVTVPAEILTLVASELEMLQDK